MQQETTIISDNSVFAVKENYTVNDLELTAPGLIRRVVVRNLGERNWSDETAQCEQQYPSQPGSKT